MAALTGVLTFTIGGKEQQFGLLTVEDLVSITATIPTTPDDIIDLGKLEKWCNHPMGCEHYLLLAGQKVDPTLTRERVKEWGGSIRQRCRVAYELFGRSVLNGEEPETPKAVGGEPAKSLTTGG